MTRTFRLFLVLGTAAILGTGFALWAFFSESDQDRAVRLAEESLSRGEFVGTMKQVEAIVARNPRAPAEDNRLLTLAGRAAAKLQRRYPAPTLSTCGPESLGEERRPDRLFACADQMLDEGNVRDAEVLLRKTLDVDPRHEMALRNLILLLQFEGRLWDSRPLLLDAFRFGRFDRDFLLLAAASPSDGFDFDDPTTVAFVRLCQRHDKEDYLPLLGKANAALFERFSKDIEPSLSKLSQADPQLGEVHARHGRVLFELNRFRDFTYWNLEIPKNVSEHPQLWANRGAFARRRKEPDVAIRCFLEAVRTSPDHLPALQNLSELFLERDSKELSEAFGARAERLVRVKTLLESPTRNAEESKELVETLENVGRLWEALGWSQDTLRADPKAEWAMAAAERIRKSLKEDTPLTAPADSLPWKDVKIEDWPLPVWSPDMFPPDDPRDLNKSPLQ